MADRKSNDLHDRFFKYLMQIRQYATEIIAATFPEALVKGLDLSGLANKSNNLDGPRPRSLGFQADVVFECGFEERVMVTILFEHKSQKEKFPHLQLLNYMIRLWLQDARKQGFPRPILPVVFYHGQEEWEYQPFAEYFKAGPGGAPGLPKELLPYLPEFDFVFVNLQEKGDDWIKGKIQQIGLRVALLVMRNIRSPLVLDRLEQLFEGFEEMQKSREGREMLEEISLYLFSGAKGSKEKIIDAMKRARIAEYEFEPETIGWHIQNMGIDIGMEEGMAIGKAKGAAEERVRLAQDLLDEGFDPAKVAHLTKLSLEEVKALQNKDC